MIWNPFLFPPWVVSSVYYVIYKYMHCKIYLRCSWYSYQEAFIFFCPQIAENTYIFLWRKLIICQVQLPLISGSYLISLLISTFHRSIFYFPDLNSFLLFSKVPNLTMILYSVKDFFSVRSYLNGSLRPWDYRSKFMPVSAC